MWGHHDDTGDVEVTWGHQGGGDPRKRWGDVGPPGRCEDTRDVGPPGMCGATREPWGPQKPTRGHRRGHGDPRTPCEDTEGDMWPWGDTGQHA